MKPTAAPTRSPSAAPTFHPTLAVVGEVATKITLPPVATNATSVTLPAVSVGGSSVAISVVTGGNSSTGVQVKVTEYDAAGWNDFYGSSEHSGSVDNSDSRSSNSSTVAIGTKLESNILVVSVDTGTTNSTYRPIFQANLSHLSGSDIDQSAFDKPPQVFRHNCTEGKREIVLFTCDDSGKQFNLTCYGTAGVSIIRVCPVLQQSCNVMSLKDFSIVDRSYCTVTLITRLYTICTCGGDSGEERRLQENDKDSRNKFNDKPKLDEKELKDERMMLRTLSHSTSFFLFAAQNKYMHVLNDSSGSPGSTETTNNAVSVGVMSEYVATNFGSTIASPTSFSGTSAIQGSSVTLSAFAVVWGLGLILVIVGIAFETLRGESDAVKHLLSLTGRVQHNSVPSNKVVPLLSASGKPPFQRLRQRLSLFTSVVTQEESETEKRKDEWKGTALVHKKLFHALVDYIEETFPTVYRSRPFLLRFWSELTARHSYLRAIRLVSGDRSLVLFTGVESYYARIFLAVGEILTKVTISFFLLALLYDL